MGSRANGSLPYAGKDSVLLGQSDAEFFAQDMFVQKIFHADANARVFIDITGADAASGRADLMFAVAGFLLELIEKLMVRHRHMSRSADAKARAVFSPGAQFAQFFQQLLGVDDDAVADHAGLAGIKHSRRQKAKHVFLSVDVHGMAGVRSALIAGENIHS